MAQQHFEMIEHVKENPQLSHQLLIDNFADLNYCPKPVPQDSETPIHIAVGDLHGSAMALIYNLIIQGFLELKDHNDYECLLRIYDTNIEELTGFDLESFKNIINDAQINIKNSLTLIGDELGDRGNNDYFTLLVLKKLSEANLDITILLSNHGVGFLQDHFNTRYTGDSEEIGDSFKYARSLHNMHKLIVYGLIDETEVRSLVNDHYIPMLRAVDYSIHPHTNPNSEKDNSIVLYTHAPIDLRLLREIVVTFDIEYHDRTPNQLIETINQLNLMIGFILQSNNPIKKEVFESALTKNNSALRNLFWQRDYQNPNEIIMLPGVLDDDKTEKKGNYSLLIVHGHNGPDGLVFHDEKGKLILDKEGEPLTSPVHFNVDSNFDKADIPGCRTATHILFRTTGFSPRQLALFPVNDNPYTVAALAHEKELDVLSPSRKHRMKFFLMCNDKTKDLESINRSFSAIGDNYGQIGAAIKQIYAQKIEAFKQEVYASIEEKNKKAEQLISKIGLAVDLVDRLSKDGFLQEINTPAGQALYKLVNIAALALHFIDGTNQNESNSKALEKEESAEEMDKLEDSSMLDTNALFAQKLLLLLSLPIALELCKKLNELNDGDVQKQIIREMALVLLKKTIMDGSLSLADYEEHLHHIYQQIDSKLLLYQAYYKEDGAIKEHLKNIDNTIHDIAKVIDSEAPAYMQEHLKWINGKRNDINESIEQEWGGFYQIIDDDGMVPEEMPDAIDAIIELTEEFLPKLNFLKDGRFYQNLMRCDSKQQQLFLEAIQNYLINDLSDDVIQPLVEILFSENPTEIQIKYLQDCCDIFKDYTPYIANSSVEMIDELNELNIQYESYHETMKMNESVASSSKLSPNAPVSDIKVTKKFKEDIDHFKNEDETPDKGARSPIRSKS